MRVRRLMSCAIAAGAAACATGRPGPGAPPGPLQTVHIENPTAEVSINLAAESSPSIATIAAPIDRVWALLPSVYDSLGIPIGMANASTHVIGHSALKIRQRLGKEYLSRYIDCGRSQIGESADSYDVVLSIYTQADSVVGGATRLATTVDAMAKPATFSQAYSHCSSKSVLEAAIAKALKGRLGV